MPDIEINQEGALAYSGGDKELYLTILDVFRQEKDDNKE